MTRTDIEKTLIAELGRIAPDVEIADVDRAGDLRDEFDIDSIDFLNLVTALGKRFELEIPEADYTQIASFDRLLGYLEERAA